MHDVTIITDAQPAMNRACAEISTDMVMAMAICLRRVEQRRMTNDGWQTIWNAGSAAHQGVCLLRGSR